MFHKLWLKKTSLEFNFLYTWSDLFESWSTWHVTVLVKISRNGNCTTGTYSNVCEYVRHRIGWRCWRNGTVTPRLSCTIQCYIHHVWKIRTVVHGKTFSILLEHNHHWARWFGSCDSMCVWHVRRLMHGISNGVEPDQNSDRFHERRGSDACWERNWKHRAILQKMSEMLAIRLFLTNAYIGVPVSPFFILFYCSVSRCVFRVTSTSMR